jgi:hypothetical protein
VPTGSAVPRRATVTAIANSVGYAKRNVADECDVLEKAGLLKMRQVGNRFYYSLARGTQLRQFAGDIAEVRPDWTSLFAVTSALVALEERARSLPDRALMVDAYRVAEDIEDRLDELGIESRPALSKPDNYWPEVRDFALELLSNWAAGRWMEDAESAPVRLRPKRATHS